MHRDKNFESGRSHMGTSHDSRVSSWQKDVANSTAGRDLQTTTGPAKITVNNITTPTMMINQSPPETKPRNEISSKAIIGTLLGAAAGAAVAYAMTRAEEESPPKVAEPRIISYRTIEAPKPPVAQSVVESRQPYVESVLSYIPRTVVQQIEYPKPPASVVRSRSAKSHHTANSARTLDPQPIAAPPPPRSTLINTFIPPSEVPRYPRPAPLVRSHTDGQIRSSASHALSSSSGTSRHSKAPPSSSSAAHTITPADFIPAAPASVVTEVRIARDLPLPDSRAASTLLLADPPNSNASNGGGGSVAPSDSISQAGSKKSRHSRRSRRNSSSGHGHGPGGGGGGGGGDNASRASRASESKPSSVRENNSNNSTNHGSNRQKRESTTSLPLRPASQSHSRIGGSVHHRRSLMGFLGA